MKSKMITIATLLILLTVPTSSQEIETGETIWQHSFSNGMPSEFQRNAGYLNTGTWGCLWSQSCDDGSQTSTGGAYEPASISGNYLRLLGKKSSSRSVAFPTHLETSQPNLENWLFHYRVDPEPKTSDKHSDRDTAGFRTSPNWYENHNRPGRCPGVNWQDEGSTIVICNGQGDSLIENSGMDAVNNEYHVKVASTPGETLVKYWQPGNTEPSTWQHQTQFGIQGIPAFYASAAFHTNRWNDYLFYDLKKISTDKPPHKPSNPLPADTETGVETNATLSVDVSDPEGQPMNITFYNAANNTPIGTDNNVPSSGTATIQWENLENGKTQEWYAIANDGTNTNQSNTWNFTTQHIPEITGVSLSQEQVSTSPDLSVNVTHQEGQTMYITFFLNGTPIGEDQTINGEGTATITPDLNASTEYQWHVVVEDANGNTATNENNPKTFTTQSGNPGIEIMYGHQVNFHPDNVILDVKPSHNYTDTVDTVRLLDENQNVIETVNNVNTGQPVSLTWNNLQEDKRYNWTAQIIHDGEPETVQGSFTTLTLDINLAKTVSNADKYNIYRRQGTQNEETTFQNGEQDYTHIGSTNTLNIVDATENLSEGNYCYIATAENNRAESPPSTEKCIQDLRADQ